MAKVITEPLLRVSVYSRQSKHQNAGKNEYGVKTGQACEKREDLVA